MKKIKKELTIDNNASLISAMESIGSSSERILFVTDEENKLLGTITDGDIRRALINKIDLETPVCAIMCENPITVSESHTKNSIVRLMTKEKILVIPVLDKEGILIGYESILNLSRNQKRDNAVLIMAGGFGKRLRPMTKTKPKPMLSIAGKPILEQTIKQLSESGFVNIFISTHYKGEMIEEYFGNGDKWGISIQYLKEEQPMGTAGSLNLLSEHIKNDLPILVLNADLVTTLDFTNLIDFHNINKAIMTLCTREQQETIPFGVVSTDDKNVLKIEEKPIHNYFANAGIYVVTPSIFKIIIELKRNFDMPVLVNYLIENGHDVNAFPIHEYWIDIGRINDFKKAETDIKQLK